MDEGDLGFEEGGSYFRDYGSRCVSGDICLPLTSIKLISRRVILD